jgi:hypothetical protein
MTSDDKTNPAPKTGTAAKKDAAAKKDEGQAKDKTTSDADLSKAEGGSWQWNTAPSWAWQEPPRPCCEIESATTVKVSAR